MSNEFRARNKVLSEPARDAFEHLKSLGYDVDALVRMGMSEQQVLDLRDKAFRYRGMQIPAASSQMKDLVSLFGLGVDLSIKSPPTEGRMLASHILYLAEKQLAEM